MTTGEYQVQVIRYLRNIFSALLFIASYIALSGIIK